MRERSTGREGALTSDVEQDLGWEVGEEHGKSRCMGVGGETEDEMETRCWSEVKSGSLDCSRREFDADSNEAEHDLSVSVLIHARFAADEDHVHPAKLAAQSHRNDRCPSPRCLIDVDVVLLQKTLHKTHTPKTRKTLVTFFCGGSDCFGDRFGRHRGFGRDARRGGKGGVEVGKKSRNLGVE